MEIYVNAYRGVCCFHLDDTKKCRVAKLEHKNQRLLVSQVEEV